MPDVLQIACRQPRPSAVVEQLVPILKALLRRSTYLALLRENPEAVQIFVRLAGQSRWVAEQLAAHPVFMEVLLDKHAWDLLSGRDALVDELGAALAAAEDEEALVDGLRAFKEQRVFRVAVAETRGPVAHHACQRLSELARRGRSGACHPHRLGAVFKRRAGWAAAGR